LLERFKDFGDLRRERKEGRSTFLKNQLAEDLLSEDVNSIVTLYHLHSIFVLYQEQCPLIFFLYNFDI